MRWSRFQESVQPILIDHCYRCHADGMTKGGMAFDEDESDEALVKRRDLWSAVLKNVRAGIMPPADKPRPTAQGGRESWPSGSSTTSSASIRWIRTRAG